MNKQQRGIGLKIACAALIITFFFSWLSAYGFSQSAYDIIFGGNRGTENMGALSKLSLILLPICGGVILFYEIQKKGAFPFSKKILFSIPAAAVVLFFITVQSKIYDMKQRSYEAVDISAMSMLAVGFWLCLLAAAFICYLGFTADPVGAKSETITEQKNQ